MLEAPTPFLSLMSAAVRAEMKEAYPELEETPRACHARARRRRASILAHRRSGAEEARRGHRTADSRISADRQLGALAILAGAKAFKLYDTYGLPLDFIEDVTRDAGVQVDWAGFDRAMEEQRTRAKASWKGAQQGSRQSRSTRSSRETFQDRAGLLLRHRARATAASKPSSPKKARSTKSRPARKPKSSSTAPRSTPNPAARWPTRAASTTIPDRSKSPKCAARIIRSPA